MKAKTDNTKALTDLLSEMPTKHLDRNSCAEIAEYLIANGVIVSNKPKPKTNLAGKCGSCIYAKPIDGVSGYTASDVRCTNEEHLSKHCKVRYATIRKRTTKGCKLYCNAQQD